MPNELTKANINLYAVLRNMEELCELDRTMYDLIQNRNLSIQFSATNGPKALLSFKSGKCHFTRGTGKNNIKLYFKSPKHFNQLIEGTANPIPLKGFTKLSFLTKDFTKLTEKLTYYLTPTDERLKDPSYLKINTILTAYTAFYALGEIGNTDAIGKLNASRIPDGIINISVLNGGPSIHIIASKGHLEIKKGLASSPRASMTFADMETTNLVLNGKIDTYTCIASEKIKMKGYIPMLDNMNKLLSQVPAFL
ncbi:hypothetical protein [Chengkuizengella sediminis]|uniref:hypothetical protein n=1 Tax=Chengkuizengella sediminis TaxID=1885917 RepID=UPI001389C6DE|nr:hypothetical protein [Chengkuizengella sediminis]NDI34975.1 hypothetical protein [Chengkuizengella sediminis]